MKKGVKKGLILGGGIIIVLLAVLISIPFLFKEKLKEAVVNAANENLNAKVYIEDFGLNMFTNFPNITLSLEDVSISGIGDFEGDTLLKAKSADATLNIVQLFKGNYQVSKINLDEAAIYAKVLSDGRVNWDIMKPDSTEVETSDTDFKLRLEKVSLDNCRLVYEDQTSKMKVVLAEWSGNISGDLSAENTTIVTKSSIGEVSFVMDGIPYLSKIKGVANATVDADLNNIKFTFVESDLQLNEIKASLDGSVAMVGEEGIDFDLKLKAPDTQFKDILSMIPAIYSNDFKDIKTSGTASIEGFVKGLMEGDRYPAFDFKLLVKDAMFQYPSLPKSVNNINMNINISNSEGSLDNMIVDISKFDFTMGGNPFSASLNVRTPMSDPNLKAHVKGLIDLSMIKEVYPLEQNTELNGKLNADLNVATRMSAVEKEQYENVKVSGSLKVNGMTYKSEDGMDVIINNAALDFSSQYVNLSSLDMKMGKNDIAATGRLENFIGYLVKDQVLKGQLNMKSNYFDLDDFMGEDEEDASSSEHFVVPTNINFVSTADMSRVIYNKIDITNLKGTLSIKDGVINMQNVTANALGGTAKVTGSYSTAQDPKNPKVTLALNVSKASFSETFKSVESIQKFAPVFDKILGNYSMNIDLNTVMGADVMQMLAGLTATGALQANEVQVQGVEALSKLSSSLKTDVLKSFTAKDINIPFSIKDGKINTKLFTLSIGDGGKLSLEGVTGLDQSINYKGNVTLPKAVANNFVNNIPITIGGTFTDPKVGVDTKGLVNSLADKASEKILGGTVEEKKDEAIAKLNEEKAKQIQNLRNNAKAASEKLINEAQAQGQKLVEAAEPKGAIAKMVAQKAADKLVSEAEKNAKKMTDEAEVQIQKLESE